MRVEFAPISLPGLPAPEGAHRLAWSYLLDAVFADAYHGGIHGLQVALPEPLFDEVRLRGELSERASAPTGPGPVALLTAGETLHAATAFARVYRLRFGPLAPSALRRRATPPPNRRLEQQLFVFTLTSRLWGLPLRLLNLARLPHLADRALIQVRTTFARTRPTPSFYVLEVWR